LKMSLIGGWRRIRPRPMAAPMSRASTSSSGVAKNRPMISVISLSEYDCALLRKWMYTRQDSVTQKSATRMGNIRCTAPHCCGKRTTTAKNSTTAMTASSPLNVQTSRTRLRERGEDPAAGRVLSSCTSLVRLRRRITAPAACLSCQLQL
jgi:hypothetical protein